MGEVYRADDLSLDQAVALKFLPEATSHDDPTLERFRNEVRIARRISHPNVCRIYDIGEAEGLLLLNAPMTANFSSWFIGSTIFVYAIAVALSLFAFYTSLAGQKLWKEELFE